MSSQPIEMPASVSTQGTRSKSNAPHTAPQTVFNRFPSQANGGTS